MIHDRSLVASKSAPIRADGQLYWVCNAHACKLLGMVRSVFGNQAILPVSHLKRCGFTRRQWELATKGTRERVGSKLVSSAPAKDGLEFYGIVNEVTITEPGERPKTFWVLGEVTEEKVQACSDEFHAANERARSSKVQADAASDQIDSQLNDDGEADQQPVPSPDPVERRANDDFDHGCAYQHPISYAQGADDTLEAIAGFCRKDPIGAVENILNAVGPRCSKEASIIKDYKLAAFEHPDFGSEAALEAQQRAESEKHLGF